jgi:two-component system response regulator NreC
MLFFVFNSRYDNNFRLKKQIADRLELSPHTVENHKTRIFHKLGINNTVEMLQYALKHGIINV